MSYLFSELCKCGATDCPHCYPGASQQYTCNVCYADTDTCDLDIEQVCRDCRDWDDEEAAAQSLVEELNNEGMNLSLARKVVAAIADENIENVHIDHSFKESK